ncbi:hypothetical protein H8D57_02335, partial [bacterium]|nr:hypothetical protein [bacterium]
MKRLKMKNRLASPWLGLAVIALTTICIYSNIYRCPLIFDDLPRIKENVKIRNLSNLLSVSQILKPRAIVDLTFALNYSWGKLNVFGFHLTNVLIHILNGFFVYILGTIMFEHLSGLARAPNSSLKFVPLFAALVFVTHPIQTQVVTYTVQRYASMAALFYLASVLFYIKARIIQKCAEQKGQREEEFDQGSKLKAQSSEVRGQRSEDRGQRIEDSGQRIEFKVQRLKGNWFSAISYQLSALYFLSILCGLLSFLSKQNTASLPGVILLVEYLLIDRTWQGWKKKLLWFTPAFVLWVLFIAYVSGLFSGGGWEEGLLEDVSERMMETESVDRWNYLYTQFNVLVVYIRLLCLPINQNLDYMYPFNAGFFDGYTPLAFLLMMCISVISIWMIKRSQIVSLAILWFFITLSVESSIIPIRDALF